MLDLALQQGRGPALVPAIAARQGLPPKYLHVLVGSLRQAGLVKAQRGPSGGCELARPATAISALDILHALEGPAPVAELGTEPGASARAVAELWHRSAEASREVLRNTTLADLAARHRAIEVDSHGYSI